MPRLTHAQMTAVAEPKPWSTLPEGYEPHRWLAAPAGRPGTATRVITSDGMSYCTGCRKWFRFVDSEFGTYAVGTDGEQAVSCGAGDWHGPACNCFGHPQPNLLYPHD